MCTLRPVSLRSDKFSFLIQKSNQIKKTAILDHLLLQLFLTPWHILFETANSPFRNDLKRHCAKQWQELLVMQNWTAGDSKISHLEAEYVDWLRALRRLPGLSGQQPHTNSSHTGLSLCSCTQKLQTQHSKCTESADNSVQAWKEHLHMHFLKETGSFKYS